MGMHADAQQSALPFVDATLTVTLEAGKSWYAMGELIPLVLEFRSEADADYYFTTAAPRAFGTPWDERFTVTPADGVENPTADFLEASGGIAGSIISSWPPLDGTPFRIRVNLNDWIRFTRPGDYELVVTSPRLQRYTRRPAPELRSNTLSIHIEPATDDWSSVQFQRALAAIETGDPEQRPMATAILRHLQTREAASGLLMLYGEGMPDDLDTVAGLFSSPYREHVVTEMEAALDASRAVSNAYLSVLARLRSLLEIPAGTTEFLVRLERVRVLQSGRRRKAVAEPRAVPPVPPAQPATFSDVADAQRALDTAPPCAIEAAALAYLLERNPPPAVRRLQPDFPRPNGCVRAPLQQLAPLSWDQRVEEAAIAHLRGRDSDGVSQAARLLGAYGSARVKDHLFDRLAEWQAEWRGREAELDTLAPRIASSPEQIENAITMTLFNNRRITLSPEEKERIRALCVTDRCRSNADRFLAQ
jgi:hypothetical protein